MLARVEIQKFSQTAETGDTQSMPNQGMLSAWTYKLSDMTAMLLDKTSRLYCA